jgi:small-conductance mechanosensitive channel
MGVVMGLAVFAIFMPLSWMDCCHRLAFNAPLPSGPVVEYLARSTSGLYASFGGLFLVLATDVKRHARVIAYAAIASIVFGVIVLVIDLVTCMPWYWTVGEGPVQAAYGVVVLALQRRAGRGAPGEAPGTAGG